jgi:hypothetical protein
MEHHLFLKVLASLTKKIWLHLLASMHLPPLPSSLMTLLAVAKRLTEPPSKQMGHSLLQWVKLLRLNKSKLIKGFGIQKHLSPHSTDLCKRLAIQKSVLQKQGPHPHHVCFLFVSRMGSGRRGCFWDCFQSFKTWNIVVSKITETSVKMLKNVKVSSPCGSLRFFPVL